MSVDHDQEAFNVVYTHLLTQNAKSVDEDEDFCMYRGANGMKCAIGPLITDEEYNIFMEGNEIRGNPLVRPLMESKGYTIALLGDLQTVHDSDMVYMWKIKLESVAEKWGLTLPGG